MLAEKMSGKSAAETIRIPPVRVAVRQSTDFIVIEDADVAQAAQFIRQYACQGIDVDRVVREVGVSRRTLELKFQRYMGRAPKAEIRRVRIEHAKILLTRTKKTIDAVAHMSGFPSTKYFATAFYREVGVMPSAYRKAHRL
jgi:LacI family transcriptional regulator